MLDYVRPSDPQDPGQDLGSSPNTDWADFTVTDNCSPFALPFLDLETPDNALHMSSVSAEWTPEQEPLIQPGECCSSPVEDIQRKAGGPCSCLACYQSRSRDFHWECRFHGCNFASETSLDLIVHETQHFENPSHDRVFRCIQKALYVLRYLYGSRSCVIEGCSFLSDDGSLLRSHQEAHYVDQQSKPLRRFEKATIILSWCHVRDCHVEGCNYFNENLNDLLKHEACHYTQYEKPHFNNLQKICIACPTSGPFIEPTYHCDFQGCHTSYETYLAVQHHNRYHHKKPDDPHFFCLEQHCRFATKRWLDLIRYTIIFHCSAS